MLKKKCGARSVQVVSNEVAPLPSCQLVSLKLPYIHTSLPPQRILLLQHMYNILYSNRHGLWKFQINLKCDENENADMGLFLLKIILLVDLRGTRVSLYVNIIAPSPSLDGRSYVHIEWPRQLLPPLTHYIALFLQFYIPLKCIEIPCLILHYTALNVIEIHYKD